MASKVGRVSVGDVVEINEVCKFHMNIENASQVGSHLQNGMVCKINVHCRCVYREQDSPGSVGGSGCGSVEDGEL